MALRLTTPSISYRKILFGYLGWWLCWMILQTLVLHYSVGFDWKLSLQDAITTNLILTLGSYLMITITRFYEPRPVLRMMYGVGLSIGCIILMKWFVKEFMNTDPAYITFVEQTLFIRSLFAWLMISLLTMMSWMWFYLHEQQEIQNRKADTEKLAREAELSKLRQQLQPHFLFNSLNSISALTGSKPEEARKMIQQLSDFLRGTIKRDDQQFVTLEEELKHLQLYLDIEKVRFGHRLKTTIDHEDALASQLPTLLLQPIVENAIKFGLYDTIGEVTIRVQARLSGQYLLIQVENPFDPRTAQPRQGTGFGLSSVQRRLYLLYARQDLLKTEQNGNTFITQVSIPQSL